jgi:hypothetical protein
LDLWSGWRDEARTMPREQDTLVNVFSTTKTVLPLAALVLVDQGELDLHALVTRYEFAVNGKQSVRFRYLLSTPLKCPDETVRSRQTSCTSCRCRAGTVVALRHRQEGDIRPRHEQDGTRFDHRL